jgi:hypothetical protein
MAAASRPTVDEVALRGEYEIGNEGFVSLVHVGHPWARWAGTGNITGWDGTRDYWKVPSRFLMAITIDTRSGAYRRGNFKVVVRR